MKPIFICVLLVFMVACGGGADPVIDDIATDTAAESDAPLVDNDDISVDGDEPITDPDLPLIEQDVLENDEDQMLSDTDEDIPVSDDLWDDEDDAGPDDAIPFPACAAYGTPQSSATLTHEDLKEISGVAVSYRNPGIVWTHNDSDSKAALFAIGLDGVIRAQLNLTGATNIDWEAMALMPCGVDECIYIADTGDNSLVRSDYSILVLKEPEIDSALTGQQIDTADWAQFPISYGDGSHNTEAFAVHPDGGLYLFTKEIGTTAVYKADELVSGATTFARIGEIYTGIEVPGYPAEAQPSLVTAADIHRNGDRLILRMYGIYTTDGDGVYEFAVLPGQPFDSFIDAAKVALPEGADMQGEAISYDPVVGGYLHTSEFINKVIDFNPKLWHIACGN